MSALYEPIGEAFGTAKVNWLVDDFVVVLLDLKEYLFNKKHALLSQISSNACIAVSDPITGKRVSGFTFYADKPAIFPEVIGPKCEAMVLVQWNGGAQTSRLVAYIDRGAKLPFTPNGGRVEMGFSEQGVFIL